MITLLQYNGIKKHTKEEIKSQKETILQTMSEHLILFRHSGTQKLKLTFFTRYQRPITDEIATQIKSTRSNLKLRCSEMKIRKNSRQNNKIQGMKD